MKKEMTEKETVQAGVPLIRWLILGSIIQMIAVNALANILPINNITTGAVSDSYPVLFTPAGYVFSIWGLIYLALIGFGLYQLSAIRVDQDFINKIALPIILGNLANAGWIFCWHYRSITLSVLLMLVILTSLIIVYKNISSYRAHFSPREQLLLSAPFSLYFGWISVATIANISVWLYSLNWNGFGLSPVFWTVVVLVIGTGLGAAMLFKFNDLIFAGVVIWAFAGIQFKPEVEATVGLTAGLCAAGLITLAMVLLLRTRQRELMTARKDRRTD